MTAIARAAGVTPTTIDWYLKDKDALLVAVPDHVLEAALAAAPDSPTSPGPGKLRWATEQLNQHRRLVTAVHTRTATFVGEGLLTRPHRPAERRKVTELLASLRPQDRHVPHGRAPANSAGPSPRGRVSSQAGAS